jgi:hypothetical protein
MTTPTEADARAFRVGGPCYEVLAIEMQEIEGVKNDAVRLPHHGGVQRLEVRSAVAILHNRLTADDSGLAAKLGSGTHDGRVAVAPIESVASEDARLARSTSTWQR